MDREALQRMVDASPLHRWMGLQALSVDAAAGAVALRLPWRDEFARGDGAEQLHGGVTAALIDVAGDCAVAVRARGGVPTVSLSVDYLRMAEGSGLVAEAQVVKLGRRLSLADVRVLDDAGRLIAVGRASYAMPAGG
jgi:uncharacterized protein (TIGR00369 family)